MQKSPLVPDDIRSSNRSTPNHYARQFVRFRYITRHLVHLVLPQNTAYYTAPDSTVGVLIKIP